MDNFRTNRANTVLRTKNQSQGGFCNGGRNRTCFAELTRSRARTLPVGNQLPDRKHYHESVHPTEDYVIAYLREQKKLKLVCPCKVKSLSSFGADFNVRIDENSGGSNVLADGELWVCLWVWDLLLTRGLWTAVFLVTPGWCVRMTALKFSTAVCLGELA